jgi:dTDP-4-dehydrorhamnose 3,5-epimerase
VDIRPSSPTFGRWQGCYLDDEKHEQLFIPIGFAHGFCVVSEVADVMYKVSAVYDPATECSVRFDDADIGVEWPLGDLIVSGRDRSAEGFATLRARLLASSGEPRG